MSTSAQPPAPQPPPPTLRDDWQERRAFLAQSPDAESDYVCAQLRVLDYLLHR